MPLTYTKDDACRRVVITAAGTVARQDLLALVQSQLDDGSWSYACVYDTRGRSEPATTQDVQEAVAFWRHMIQIHGARGPVALVADAGVGYGMARMFALLGDDSSIPVAIFPDLASAEAWLDSLP